MAGFDDEEDLDSQDVDAVPAEEEAAAPAPEADQDTIEIPAPATAPGVTQTGLAAPATAPVSTGPRVANLQNSVTKTNDQHGTINPLSAKEYIAAGKQAQDANIGVADTQRSLAEATQNATIASEKFNQAQIEHAQAKEQTNRAILDQKQEQLDGAQKQFEEATVDPNHYWKTQPLGSKVMSLVAIGLSGLGNAYSASASPGSNQHANGAWDIIKERIDQDINAQRANIDKQGRALSSRSSELQNLRQRFGDDRQADLAFAAQQYAAFGKLAQTEADKSGNPIYKARADQLNAAIGQDTSKTILDLTKGIHDQAKIETDKQVVAKTAELPLNKDSIQKKPQIQQSAVDAQQAIDQVQDNIKKDGTFGSGFKTMLAKYGIRSGKGYNSLETDKQLLFLNEARALLNNRISAKALDEMAKAKPNMFNDPKVLIEQLKSFRNNNIAQSEGFDVASRGLMRTGSNRPEYDALKQRVQAEQQDEINRNRTKK